MSKNEFEECMEQIVRDVIASDVTPKFNMLKSELKGDTASVRQDIASVRNEMKGDIASVRQDIADLVDAHKKTNEMIQKLIKKP